MLARSVAFPALVLHPVGTLLHFTESLEERGGKLTKAIKSLSSLWRTGTKELQKRTPALLTNFLLLVGGILLAKKTPISGSTQLGLCGLILCRKRSSPTQLLSDVIDKQRGMERSLIHRDRSSSSLRMGRSPNEKGGSRKQRRVNRRQRVLGLCTRRFQFKCSKWAFETHYCPTRVSCLLLPLVPSLQVQSHLLALICCLVRAHSSISFNCSRAMGIGPHESS